MSVCKARTQNEQVENHETYFITRWKQKCRKRVTKILDFKVTEVVQSGSKSIQFVITWSSKI